MLNTPLKSAHLEESASAFDIAPSVQVMPSKTAEETSGGDGRVEPTKREQQWPCEANTTLDQLAHRRRGS